MLHLFHDRHLARLLSVLFLFLLTGCQRSTSNALSSDSNKVATADASSSSSLPQAAQLEEFHSVEPATAGLSFELSALRMEWNREGWMNGAIGSFKVIDSRGRSMPVALLSNSIIDGQITTRDFGVIKARNVGGLSVDYLMQDSHLKELQTQLQNFPNVKQQSHAPASH